jgi:hypothetical protein
MFESQKTVEKKEKKTVENKNYYNTLFKKSECDL